MDSKTLKALKASIKKWERCANPRRRTNVALGPDNCPLCKLFLHKECEGCPVKDKTETKYCYNTPYQNDDLEYMWEDDETLSKEFFIAAAKERDFLISLLPKET